MKPPVIDKFLFIESQSTKTVFSHRGIRVVFMVEQSETKADIFKSIPFSFVSMKPSVIDTLLITKSRSTKTVFSHRGIRVVFMVEQSEN